MKYIIVLLFSIGLSAQEFDFDCIDWNNPQNHLEFFKEKAFEVGYNFNDLNVDFIVGEQELYGSTGFDCDPNNDAIIYLSNSWINLNKAEKSKVVFHELGHTAMLYNHSSINHNNNNANPNDNTQIMWIGSDNTVFPNGYNYNLFLESLTDFFNPSTQFQKQGTNCNDNIKLPLKTINDITINTPIEQYYNVFINDAFNATGIEYSNTDVSLTLGSAYGAYGTALYACNDSRVSIEISTTEWNRYGIANRLWIVYHELGHDILNLEHNTYLPIVNEQGVQIAPSIPEIMITGITALATFDLDQFIVARDRMFNDINQVHKQCN